MSPYFHGVRESWRVSRAHVPRKHAPVQTGFDFESLALNNLLSFQGTNILCTFVRHAGLTSLEDVPHVGSPDCAQCAGSASSFPEELIPLAAAGPWLRGGFLFPAYPSHFLLSSQAAEQETWWSVGYLQRVPGPEDAGGCWAARGRSRPALLRARLTELGAGGPRGRVSGRPPSRPCATPLGPPL